MTTSKPVKKRFIAGAKCPKCELVDKIVLLTTEDDEHIECVNCGYKESKSDLDQGTGAPDPGDVQAVKFIEPQ